MLERSHNMKLSLRAALPLLVGLPLLFGCGGGDGGNGAAGQGLTDSSGNYLHQGCDRTMCDVDYDQCVADLTGPDLCGQCIDGCSAIDDPGIESDCLTSCDENECSAPPPDLSPCGNSLQDCRKTARNAQCAPVDEGGAPAPSQRDGGAPSPGNDAGAPSPADDSGSAGPSQDSGSGPPGPP